jgi:hypothetical protein
LRIARATPSHPGARARARANENENENENESENESWNESGSEIDENVPDKRGIPSKPSWPLRAPTCRRADVPTSSWGHADAHGTATATGHGQRDRGLRTED